MRSLLPAVTASCALGGAIAAIDWGNVVTVAVCSGFIPLTLWVYAWWTKRDARIANEARTAATEEVLQKQNTTQTRIIIRWMRKQIKKIHEDFANHELKDVERHAENTSRLDDGSAKMKMLDENIVILGGEIKKVQQALPKGEHG